MFRNAFWVLAAVLAFCQNASTDDNNCQLKEICNVPGSELLDGKDSDTYLQSHEPSEMQSIYKDTIKKGAENGEKFSDVLLRAAEKIWKPLANSPVCDGIPDGDYMLLYDLSDSTGKHQQMTLIATVKEMKVSENLKINEYFEDELIQALDQKVAAGDKSYSLKGYAIDLDFFASRSLSASFNE